MANYPLITGNTDSRLNRINTTNFSDLAEDSNATTFLTKKITDSNGIEFIYAVLIIESNGSAGSVLDITGITLKDADSNVIASESETNPVQQNLFVMSPLRKTGTENYTSNIPFMGTTNADFSQGNIHTIESGLSTDITSNSSLAKSYLGIQISAQGVISIMTAAEAQASSFANVTAFVPLYNHADIVANDIPQGRYAALLFKVDPRQVTVDGQQSFTLTISHNGVNELNEAQDYNLRLSVTGDNVFVAGLNFNSSAVTNNGTLPTRKTLMSKIQDDQYTGLSWPSSIVSGIYPFTDGSTPESGPSNADGVVSPADMSQVISSYLISGVDQSLFTNADNIDSMVALNGALFRGDKFTFFDASTFVSEFECSIDDNRSSKLIQDTIDASINFNKFTLVPAGDSLTIRLEIPSTSTLWTNGTVPIDETTGNFLNFDDTLAANSKFSGPIASYIGGTGGVQSFIVSEQQNLIYPLFTYPQDTLDLANSTANAQGTYTVTSSTPYNEQFVEHASDTIQYFRGNQTLSIFTQNVIYSNSFDFTASTQSISFHNFRINCLNDEDKLTDAEFLHGQNSKLSNATLTVVRNASSETALTTSGSSINLDDVPDAALKKKDYTAELQHDVISATQSSFLFRNSDGSYADTDFFRGFSSNDITLLAPVTAWKPGIYTKVLANSFARIPYFLPTGPSPKELTLKHSFYLTRPLFCLGYENTSLGISCAEVEFFEFKGPEGDTSHPYTADTTTATGLKQWTSNVYRETSRSLLCDPSSGTPNRMTCRFNQDATGGADRASYVNGNEIFNINDSEGFSGVTKRAFIANVTSGSATNPQGQTTFDVVDIDGNAINSTVLVNEASYGTSGFDFTLTIGKPVYAVGQRKTDFVHSTSGTNGSFEEYDRVNCSYGTDLSYCIKSLTPDKLIVGDKFYVTDGGGGNGVNALIGGGTANGKTTHQVSNATSSIDGGVDIYNFSPVEKGLYNGATQIKSIRNFNPTLKADVYNATKSDIIYVSLSSQDLDTSTNTFTASFKLNPFNAGDEDIIMVDAVLFDPYYLPAGVFEDKPSGSPEPVWLLVNKHTTSSGSATFNIGVDANNSELKPADTITFDASQSQGETQAGGSLTRLQKSPVLDNGLYEGLNQTTCTVSFNVATDANVAGDYYKAIEFSYYRDYGYGQKRYSADGDGTTEIRKFKERPLWKARKLLRVSIAAETKISVTDTDITPFSTSDDVDFGTISIG